MLGIGWSATRHRLCGMLFTAMLFAGCATDKNAGTSSATSGTADSAPASAPPATASTGTQIPITLQGEPAANVAVGSTYSFQPSAQSSAAVTFEITGMPSWAGFNSSTGELKGTPAATDEGTTGHIIISATNGSATASLTPFTIRVNAAAAASGSGAAASVKISWVAPTKNTDGSPITDLAGYHIYYGTSAGELTNTIEVSGAASTSYVIGNLSSGTYYFSVLAFNSDGADSGLSNVAAETIS